MSNYRAIATVMWKFDSKENEDVCLNQAREQLRKILGRPVGEGFDGFSVQLDLVKMKDRRRRTHLAIYKPEEIFPLFTEEESRAEFHVSGVTYHVRMNNDRYLVFLRNRKCAACGLEGTRIALELGHDGVACFNLYAEENGRQVMMTKDHIKPKSRGGEDSMENYATCCSICNNLKSDFELNYEQVKELRKIYDNEDGLSRSQVNALIQSTRLKMIS